MNSPLLPQEPLGIEWAWLAPAVCIGAFLAISLFGRYLPGRGSFLAIGAIGFGFILFWFVLRDLLVSSPGEFRRTWFAVGDDTFVLGMTIDQLAVLMMGVVTFVSLAVQIYSLGYMKGESRRGWYFAVHSLFAAAMLGLVLSNNLLLLYISWELVGLCSYLLIGFWYERRPAAEAAKKAFITTRIGDVGLLIAILVLFQQTEPNTFDIPTILAAAQAGDLSSGILSLTAILIFMGAMGKSAQVPFHIWLPDAMEGPSPVSALIHAATMVVAGVYLVARMLPLFELAPGAMQLVVIVGLITAIVGASMALVMTDLKRILAYSTISQIGFMMLALGAGGLSAGMFHLVTHAFFKALLFLGSGSVIHAMHHEQDMRKMGGLKTRLPFTHVTFLIGTLAIAGVPPLAGFFSKDEILFAGFQQGFLNGVGSAQLFWLISLLTAGMTAFYMVRCVSMTFWGESRVDESLEKKIHEPGGWIGFALFVLAIASALGGFLNVPEFLGGQASLGHFTGLHHGHSGLSTDQVRSLHVSEWQSMLLSLLIAGAGLALAIHCYGKGRDLRTSFIESSAGRVLGRLSARKFYVDEIYLHTIVRPFETLSHLLFILFDRILIDGILVNGLALLTRGIGDIFRRMQTGFIPGYLLTFGCGALVLIYILLNFLRGGGAQ